MCMHTSTVDKLLDPTDKVQKSILIKKTDIPCMEPTELKSSLIAFRIILITLGHIWPSNTHLATNSNRLNHPILI